MLAAIALMGAGTIAPIWGGPQILLETGGGDARIAFSCADAIIPGGIAPDAAGRFSARGRFTAHGGGPDRAVETPRAETANATFSGTAKGGRMTLEIRLDGVPDVQRHELVAGERPKLIRCY